MMLLLDSGFRSIELRSIELANTNLEGSYLKVMGKGSKERIVPSDAAVQEALLRYLLHFRPKPFNPAIQRLFLTLYGKPLTETRSR